MPDPDAPTDALTAGYADLLLDTAQDPAAPLR